jgi:hypothetical protein
VAEPPLIFSKKFQPLTRTTKKFPAATADWLRVFSSRRRERKKIENFQPPPQRRTSAYTSIYIYVLYYKYECIYRFIQF